MKRTLSLLPLLALLLLAASCSKTPDHASYIPKDAQFVLSLNTGALQKKLTWSFLTGSDLLKDLQRSGGGEGAEALKDIQNSGLDFSNTLYFYTKSDTRFSGSTRFSALLPIASASKLADYVRKHVPQAQLSQRAGRTVAVSDNVCMSWNDKLLMISNIAMRRESLQPPPGFDTLNIPIEMFSGGREVPDPELTLAEMDSAFRKPAENLMGDKRFSQLQGDGHDLSVWISYDRLMNSLQAQRGMGMMGALSSAFWENSAMAAGMDFRDGEITANGKYFVSDSLRSIAKEFAKSNVDANMLQRIPAQGLNFALGYHVNMDAIRQTFDKMGFSAIANNFLAEQGLSLDDVLNAFTGDLVLAVNNFRIESKMQEVDSTMRELYGMRPYPVKRPALDVVFAMKVKDQARVQKLMGFASQTGALAVAGPNMWSLANSDGSVVMQQNEFLIAGSSQPVANAFLSARGGSMPPAVKQEISGHPYGMWADVNSIVTGAASGASGSPSDEARFNAVRGVFSTFTANGGEFQGDASVFNMKLEFTNKKENSLLQLAQLIQRVSSAGKARPVATR